MCESGDSPGGWSCLTGCRALDAALKKRSGDCPEQIGLAIHRIPDLISDKQGGEAFPSQQPSLFPGKSVSLDQILLCIFCIMTAILPPIPTVRILEEKHPPSFFVSWDSGENAANISSYPVVYVLQVKSYFGPEFDNRMSSPWKTLVMSTLKGAQLSDPAVGWWYQFQVAAVNQWGSLGFDVPSPPVQLTTLQPSPPSPPRDLTDELLTLQANGKIKLQIHWSSPAKTILPVTEYRVSWGPDLANIGNNHEFTEKPTQFVHTLPSVISDKLSTDKSLSRITLPDSAMSEWGSTQLRSQPNTLFIHTPSVDSIQDEGDVALNTYLKNFDSNTPQYQKGMKYSNAFSGISPKENSGYISSQQEAAFVCNGTSKSLVFKGPFSQGSLGPLSSMTTELSIKTDTAVFDGRDLTAELSVFENEVLRGPTMELHQQSVSPRPILVRWTPQVCIETVIVTGSNLDETNAFQSETLIANNLEQFTKPSYIHVEKENGRKESLRSSEKYVLLNPVKQGVDNYADDSKQTKSILRHATLKLTNLYFNCRYLIELLSDKEDQSKRPDQIFQSTYTSKYNLELSAWLCTPSSSIFKKTVLDIISEPQDVSYKQISIGPTISYNISWKSGVLKSKSDSTAAKENYSGKTNKIFFPVHHRIIWGPSRDSAMKSVVWKSWPNLRPRIDQTRAETKVLRNSETSIVLDNLLPSTLYVVSLQAMTGEHNIPHSEDASLHAKMNSNPDKDYMKSSLMPFQSITPNSVYSHLPMKYFGTSKEVFIAFETPANVNILDNRMNHSHSSQKFLKFSRNGSPGNWICETFCLT
ncbi:unnamed protein product [Trichobilharzia regenti]|nr:unnamed protein product [Trichobilharzia regenti]